MEAIAVKIDYEAIGMKKALKTPLLTL